MKIILTGTTGFVGTEVLAQALANEAITALVVLSRKPLPEPLLTANPKVTVKIIDDFLHYPDSLLNELAGAEGCIWSLGLATSSDLSLYRKVNHEYTLAAVNAFARIPSASSTSLSSTSPASRGERDKPFRFIYCSGAAAVRDQEKTLWFMGDIRRIRGQTESALLAYHSHNQSQDPKGDNTRITTRRRIDTSIVRPAMIIAKEWWTLHSMLFSLGPSIRVDRLARVMLELAVVAAVGGDDRRSEKGQMKPVVLENWEMNSVAGQG
ncbi:hypothetical protein BJY01DRAFT_236289 [Aspergillus pseudoustus]|uniref:Nucleoside-diphosphate-sugar epimerase n=1 Tax=Aspergillus pseudoustus TaxID=1810923 RepID=A0ABR4JNV2_9EURO